MTFYLLLGSFLPRTDFGQLLKLHNLVQHYQLHVQEAEALGQATSIKEFLWDHFVNPDGHKHGDNGSSHQSLPFHSAVNGVHFVFQQMELPTFQAANIIQPLLSSTKSWIPSNLVSVLFRPPIH